RRRRPSRHDRNARAAGELHLGRLGLWDTLLHRQVVGLPAQKQDSWLRPKVSISRYQQVTNLNLRPSRLNFVDKSAWIALNYHNSLRCLSRNARAASSLTEQ